MDPLSVLALSNPYFFMMLVKVLCSYPSNSVRGAGVPADAAVPVRGGRRARRRVRPVLGARAGRRAAGRRHRRRLGAHRPLAAHGRSGLYLLLHTLHLYSSAVL